MGDAMRVLMLGPWAVARPRHGGQIRAASIIEAYRGRGHEVMFIGIFDPGNVPFADTGPNDIVINDTAMAYMVSVSDADAASFRRIGAHHVEVARNGSSRPEPT